jgi:hypothetical protein
MITRHDRRSCLPPLNIRLIRRGGEDLGVRPLWRAKRSFLRAKADDVGGNGDLRSRP